MSSYKPYIPQLESEFSDWLEGKGEKGAGDVIPFVPVQAPGKEKMGMEDVLVSATGLAATGSKIASNIGKMKEAEVLKSNILNRTVDGKKVFEYAPDKTDGNFVTNFLDSNTKSLPNRVQFTPEMVDRISAGEVDAESISSALNESGIEGSLTYRDILGNDLSFDEYKAAIDSGTLDYGQTVFLQSQDTVYDPNNPVSLSSDIEIAASLDKPDSELTQFSSSMSEGATNIFSSSESVLGADATTAEKMGYNAGKIGAVLSSVSGFKHATSGSGRANEPIQGIIKMVSPLMVGNPVGATIVALTYLWDMLD